MPYWRRRRPRPTDVKPKKAISSPDGSGTADTRAVGKLAALLVVVCKTPSPTSSMLLSTKGLSVKGAELLSGTGSMEMKASYPIRFVAGLTKF